jgi:type 1 glutamine amidotransferase/sugar phosphate isomerase/epimerase
MTRTHRLALLAAIALAGLSGSLGRPGRGAIHAQAAPQGQPAFARAADALERVTWRTRTLVGDDRLTRWKLAVRPEGLGLLDAVVRADAAIVNFVEGHRGQALGRTMAGTLDERLSADGIAAVRAGMGSVGLLTYRVEQIGADAGAQRQALQLAKALGAHTVVVTAGVLPPGLGAIAKDVDIAVAALATPATLAGLVRSLDGQDAHLGVGIDTGAWIEAGRLPDAALAAVGDRLRYVNLRDRAGLGPSSRNVRLGDGAGNIGAFFDELERRNLRPIAMTLDTSGIVSAPADLFAAVDAFERTVQPAYGRHFNGYAKTRPIRWDVVTPARGETLTAAETERRTAETRRSIEAALPPRPLATPAKPRTLLVVESLHGMSHDTIPHTNVMLERFGASTGAWRTVFSNDLTNLLPGKIDAYDAIFLNSVVGELFADPAVRASVDAFVRNGGGVAAIHGTPWASRNWDAFTEMIGAKDAPHRIEQGVIKVYDRSSPLTAPLGGQALEFKEEYYRFHIEGARRLRWNDVRVVLTVDLDDPTIEPRPWHGYTRADRIYPVSWIRTYGRGRVFYTSIGHMPETFMNARLVGHIVAGVQYALGDLKADATPNPPGPGSVSAR